jgi:hypothetical protein
MVQVPTTRILRGGLDLVTPALAVTPGFAIGGQNYEVEARGYRRMSGYERFDGRGRPSEASYSILSFDAGTSAFVDGETVTGGTSGATGTLCADPVVDSGSWAGNDAVGHLALYNVSGTFSDNEALTGSISGAATGDGTLVSEGASTDATHNAYIQAAIEARRALIGKPSGSGAVRGIATLSGDIYAFRDDAGATECVMHKATTSGWVAQSLGHTLDFTASTAEFTEGETITGGTSGATATVERAILSTGTWGSGTGYLVLSGITGTFQAETITGGTSAATATASGAQDAISLPAGATVRALEFNFYGTSNLTRLYGVTSEGRAFEWDGSVLAPIRVPGLTSSVDKPKYIGVHSNHLFLGYDGGALMHSGTGLPLSFLVNDGAGEIGFGEDLTGILSATSTSLVIFGRNKIGYITGSDSTDFLLRDIAEDSGARSDTAVVIGEPVFLDDRGVRSLSAAQTFGDWQRGTKSRMVEPLLASKKAAGTSITGAMRVRSKDQYRLFWGDGTGLTIYLGRDAPEPLPFTYDINPACVVSGEDTSGNEILLCGDDEGWVFELDAGTSFDGSAMTSFLRLAFDNIGSPRMNKRFHSATLEIDAPPTVTISVASDFSYGDPDLVPGAETEFSISGGGGFYDEANWNQVYWSAPIQGIATVELNGIGTNVSIAIISESTYDEPHTLSAVTYYASKRRNLR